MGWFKRWRDRTSGLGFVVNSGRMTSTGSEGATFIGHNSPRSEEVSAYRSSNGIGRASGGEK